MIEIKGKFALITGAVQGIGLATSIDLLKHGIAGVAIVDIQEANGIEVAVNLNKQFGDKKAVFIKADVTKTDELENAYKIAISKFGKLDIIMNNAGVLNERDWEFQVNLNCISVVRSTFLAVKYLGKNNGGNGGIIINISSIAGLEKMDICPVYVGTKHFVQSFTRSLATPFYYNLTGITFHVICPGITDTPLFWKGIENTAEDFSGIYEHIQEMIPKMSIQKCENVSPAIIKCIKMGENGSVWSPEGGELYKIDIPDRISIRTKQSL